MGTFTRRPIVNGDIGAWAPFEEAQNSAGVGVMTGRLYNDGAGVLKIPACLVGIDDGANKGICTFSPAEAISLAGCSNSNWLKIELTVAGAATAITAADIAGATDPTIIPASVRAAWDGLKGSFYLAATKRLLGLAWLSAAGVLLAVVNFDGQKIWASQIGLHTGTINNQYEPGKGFIIPTGAWNMDTSPGTTYSHYLGVFFAAVKRMYVVIKGNAGAYYNLDHFTDAADPSLMNGGVAGIDSIAISVGRRTGGVFDAPGFNAALGLITIMMREF